MCAIATSCCSGGCATTLWERPRNLKQTTLAGGRVSSSTAMERKASLRKPATPTPSQTKGYDAELDSSTNTPSMATAVTSAVFAGSTAARHWLMKESYIASTADKLTRGGLAQILVQVTGASSNIPAIAKEGVLAVASLLREDEEREISRVVLTEMEEQIYTTVHQIAETRRSWHS